MSETITKEELTAEVKSQIEKDQKMVDVQKQAEVAEAAKAEAEKKLADMAVKLEAANKLQAAKNDVNANADKKAAEMGMPGVIIKDNDYEKSDDQSKAIYDALRSGQKESSLTLDGMDVNGVEAGLADAQKMDARNNNTKVMDGIKSAHEGRKVAMDGASSYGPDFVPEEWNSAFYQRLATLDGDLMNYFPKIGMNTDIKNIAELLTHPTVAAYSSYVNQNLAVENVTATAVTTSNKQLQPRKFVAKIPVYNDLIEDEKFGLMKGIRNMLAAEMGSQCSNAILNGDTTGTHMDEDTEASALGANHPLAMFKGLRKLTMAGSLGIDGDSTYTLANLKSVRRLMGKYAVGKNKSKCIWISGLGTASALDTLMESSSTPQLAEFVVKEGSVLKYLGYPIILSEHQREDLEIDGYYDESGTAAAQGFLTLVNTSNFVLGIRKKMHIKVVNEDENDKKWVIATMRFDFQPFETPSTSIPTVAGMYGYTVA